MTRLCWAVLCAVACGAGCADDQKAYGGLSFDVQSSPPVPVSVESDRIELVAGIAVKVGVDLVSTGRPYTSHDVLTLRADDDDVLGVYAGEGKREYVLVGVREGDTCLEVKINRHAEECIEVRVLATEQ